MQPTPTMHNLPLRHADFANLAEALDYAAAKSVISFPASPYFLDSQSNLLIMNDLVEFGFKPNQEDVMK